MLTPSKLGQKRTGSDWAPANLAASGEAGYTAAIGGVCVPFGIIELGMRRLFGVKPDICVVDVGCGALRLAQPLSRIRAEDAGADFVCFFSVFTHLLHEQT